MLLFTLRRVWRRPPCHGLVVALLLGVLAVPGVAREATLLLKTSGQEANLVKFDPANPSAPGLSVEVMQAITRVDPGIAFSGAQVMRPVRRLDFELENGELDVFFGLVRNEARSAKLVIIEAPVLYQQYTQLAVAVRDTVDVKSFDDIRALGAEGRIGVPQGSAFVEYLNKQGDLLVDDGTLSVSATLQKLLAGRVRFVYFGGAVLAKYLRTEGLEAQIRLLPVKFNTEDVCVMFSPRADAQAVRRVRSALERLRASGELDKIRQKYGVRN